MSTKRTKVFLDTEFTELNQKAQLISIALVAETGQRFYAELPVHPCISLEQMKFLSDNVIPQLASPFMNENQDINLPIRKEFREATEYICYFPPDLRDAALGISHINQIRKGLHGFLARLGDVEIWCDVGAWDWILFCEIFGGARQIPGNVYYIPFDITTWMRIRGMDPDCDRVDLLGKPDDYPRHNALFDAMLLKELYEYMEARG